MCVTAFYLNPNPLRGSFRLVLAFNRDEYYSRPTQPADWWPDTDVIAGRDLESGKVGGTWLGVSKAGRLAFLLNYFQSSGPDPNARGRGSLVKDFLLGNSSSSAYMQEIAKEGHVYNPFNLICVDFSKDSACEACYYTNKGNKDPTKIENGFHGVSNSAFDQPWPKACHVKSRLAEIVQSAVDEDTLLQRLFDVFSQDQRLDGGSTEVLNGASLQEHRETFRAILPQLVMVKSPAYGTRSTIILVVNAENEARLVEKYLEDPIDSENPSWRTADYKFTFGESAKL